MSEVLADVKNLKKYFPTSEKGKVVKAVDDISFQIFKGETLGVVEMCIRDRWEAGQYISLERNDEYFGTMPSIENVVVQFGADTTLVAALLNGEIDVLYNLPSTEIENVEAVDGVGVYNYEMMSVYYIGLNQLDPDLSDLRVRQALAYALDKQTIVDTVYGETATVANDIFPDNHWSHNPDVTVYEYNPEKAMALLEEAGYTTVSYTHLDVYKRQPRRHVDKVYYARIRGEITEAHVKAFEEGLDIGDEKRTLPAVLEILPKSREKDAGASEWESRESEDCTPEAEPEIRVTLREGRYHQVKRMFEAVGCRVMYLKRLSMGSLRLDETLAPGEARPLTEEEVKALKEETGC